MEPTFPCAPSSHARLASLSAGVVALAATLLGSCGNGTDSEGNPVTVSTGPGGSGTFGPGGTVDTTGTGSTTTGGPVTPGVVTPGAAVPGAMTPGGAVMSTGTSTGAGPAGVGTTPGATTPVDATTPGATTPTPASGSGGAGSVTTPAAEPCVDVEAPPTEEWPDATCARWAAETTACSEDWFANYCDVSCGRCVPEGGLPVEVCEDVLPPPTEEWPDATCARWAAETTSCSEDWFANYCDISCGRCVPEGGLPEPVCEDIAPPPDPMWPEATCREWALDTTECGEQWFANYCNISCGRCVPEGGVPMVGIDCSGEGLPEVTGGEGFATRYWDCCQTHCAQSNGHRCSADGVSNTGDQNSACNGGGAFACYDEAPRAVSDCLAYGHIAKANPNCGACYRIQFTGEGQDKATDQGSMAIKGKQMIVKVSNTGSDVGGNQFDLMVPGGGVGMFNACSNQWGTSDLGAQYGGFLAECTGTYEEKKECVRQECMKIPAGSARDGCIWFVDWFQIADNPKFTSQPTDCPF